MSELTTAVQNAAKGAEARPEVKRRKMDAREIMGVFAGGLMTLAITLEGLSPVTRNAALETGAQLDAANTPAVQTVSNTAAPVIPMVKGSGPYNPKLEPGA
jgi:hypothetical protein